MRIAIAGASGYVGGRLGTRLAGLGHDVVGLARDVASVPGGVTPVAVDVGDTAALTEALRGCDRAYYLVHSLAAGADFAARDRDLARSFATASRAAGVDRIVYLGGLGGGDLSQHLDSRQEVGQLLAGTGVPLVELRAAVVLGSGSISFEMLRYLTERLPVMVCPRWINTRIQPIAERDLLEHLERATDAEVPPGVYEVGGADVTTYREMITTYARVRGLRPRTIVDVPVLTPSLSAHWVDAVTPVDRATSHSLIESLSTEVVVQEGERTRRAFGIDVMGVEAALRELLAEQAASLHEGIFDRPTLREGVYAMREEVSVAPGERDVVCAGLRECGGDLRWYGLAPAWRARILLGRLFGEHLELHRPDRLEVGARVDWWEVAEVTDCSLVLRTDRWFCGEAWLAYRVEDGEEPRVVQVGALRTKGLLGLVYWRLVWPIHLVVFELMAKRQAVVKKRAWRRR